ncbi:MAG: STAS domain-containing protein [Planctomycetota bacterium]
MEASQKKKSLWTREEHGVVLAYFSDHALLWDDDISRLEHELEELLARQCYAIVLDFSAVRRLSSSVIAHLVRFQKAHKENGGKLGLCALSPEVRKVLQLSRVEKLFTIYKDESAAVDAML